MSDQACCACLTVEYDPIDNRNGTMSERWKCRECQSVFRRDLRVSQEPSRAELQQRIATLETAAHAEANEAALTAFAARCERLESRVAMLKAALKAANEQHDHQKILTGMEKARADKAEVDRNYWYEAGVNITQETMDLRKQCHEIEAERDAAVAERDRLREAIYWALGLRGDFSPERGNVGAFWWRKGLRERAGISAEEVNALAKEASDGQ